MRQVTEELASGLPAEAPAARRGGGTAVNPPRDGAAALLRAGVEVMAEHGYHGASIRDIARAADMSTANLYHHFRSKEELLVQIMIAGIDRLLALTREALSAADQDPVSQLRALVTVHVSVHAERPRVSYVTFNELRHLPPSERGALREKMGLQQRNFDRVALDGVAAGCFRMAEPRPTARALASMCTAVAMWFDPEGTRTAEQVAAHYADLALAMFGAVDRD